MLSSLYILALITWTRDGWIGLRRSGDVNLSNQNLNLQEQVDLVSASSFFAAFQIFVLLTAWYWCKRPVARRLCLLFPGLLAVVFLNSLAANAISTLLIPPQVYWRVYWIVPWPAMASLVLIAPLQRPDWSPRARYGLYTLGLLLLLGAVSQQSIYSPSNQVEMRMPGLKVPTEYAVARHIAEQVPGRPVLVHPSVSAWLPTLHQHPYPLISRYFYANRSRFPEDLKQRLILKRFIEGRGKKPMKAKRFQRRLDHYGISLVSLKQSNRWRDQIRPALADSGFERVETIQGHELWLRPAPN